MCVLISCRFILWQHRLRVTRFESMAKWNVFSAYWNRLSRRINIKTKRLLQKNVVGINHTHTIMCVQILISREISHGMCLQLVWIKLKIGSWNIMAVTHKLWMMQIYSSKPLTHRRSSLIFIGLFFRTEKLHSKIKY